MVDEFRAIASAKCASCSCPTACVEERCSLLGYRREMLIAEGNAGTYKRIFGEPMPRLDYYVPPWELPPEPTKKFPAGGKR